MVAYDATPEQLARAVEWLQLHGLAHAVEAGPLDPSSACGQGVARFAGRNEGTLIAPQWIEVTLDGPGEVAVIRLTSQYPEGEATHRVLGWVDGAWIELGVATRQIRNGRPIVVTGPWSKVERIRVETGSSPSCVAWYEIEVLAA